MKLSILLATALLATSGASWAQQSETPKPRAERRHFDCSQAKDPKACEERQAKMKAAFEKAKAACAGKQGDEHAGCMRHEVCASAKNPNACEEAAQKRAEKKAKARQACEGKQGNERRDCVVHERCAQAKDPAKCEAMAKERAEKRNPGK